MLIVECEVCKEIQILPGSPDYDGIARVKWVCKFCGTSQIAVLPVVTDGRGDLRKIVRGLCFTEMLEG